MAKRKFSLPGIQELSKEQEDARALPRKGRHLIIGGPGTGKSVLALLRARRHHEHNDVYIFLVYNRVLYHASRQLFDSALSSLTWEHWFSKDIFDDLIKTPVPRNFEDKHKFDWDRALGIINKTAARPADNFCLIIDEGQDMPPEFYRALVNLGFENFYVIADQNQQIIQGSNSSRQDIENELDIDTNHVIELKTNFRNSYPIGRLARAFYTGDPATPPPELPPIHRSAKRPRLIEYRGNAERRKVIGVILKTADRDPSKLLGVIAPTNNVRERYVNELEVYQGQMKLDNGKIRIQTYKSGDRTQLAFDEGGIMVINAPSCKGLEFDTVFMADIDQHYCNHQLQDQLKRRFYVMVARARDHVIMLSNADNHCPAMAILPNDPDILERTGVGENE